MSKIVRDARFLIKRSTISGDIPLPGPNDDHTTWTNQLQIYEGEMFINTKDNKAWIRTENGMVEFALYDINDGLIPSEHLPSSEYLSTLDGSLEVPNDVGGIVHGTKVQDLTGKTFTQLFDSLLFPTVLAYINTNNSASLVGQSSTTVEVGTSMTPSTTATYNPGIIYNGDNTVGPNLTGNANQYIFKLPNNSVDATISASSNSQLYTFNPYIVLFGNNIWSVEINYNQGTGTYYDNKGNALTNLDSYRTADMITANTSTVTGRRYSWYGYGTQNSAPTTSANVRLLSNKVFLSSSDTGQYNISIPANTQEVYFYVPIGKTVTVHYIESSSADVTSSFTTNPITVNDANGSPQNYESWVSFIGLSGYNDPSTYRVTIS